jgi:hypothetical protein
VQSSPPFITVVPQALSRLSCIPCLLTLRPTVVCFPIVEPSLGHRCSVQRQSFPPNGLPSRRCPHRVSLLRRMTKDSRIETLAGSLRQHRIPG